MAVVSAVSSEPVLLAHVSLTTIVVGALAFFPGLHLTPAEMAAIATIATALTSIFAAYLAKPLNVGLISAGVTTILVAAAAFGLHLSPEGTAVATTAIVAVLGYLLREKLTPTVGSPAV
jgi:hypothetical protein